MTAAAGAHWFETSYGFILDVKRPDPSGISINDIAIGLSRQCRFNGHLRSDIEMYSVAQHCVLVSQCCRRENAMLGLLHDAAEAYLGDIIRPLKGLLPEYKAIEKTWERAIGERFGLGDSLARPPADIKLADEIALATERRDLLSPGPGRDKYDEFLALTYVITPLSSEAARGLFLQRFYELGGKRD